MKLKPYPKYKDSGIQWIGEIPEGWEIGRLKNKTLIKYGSSLSELDRQEGDIDVFGSNGIVGKHNRSITKGKTIIIGRKGSHGKVNLSKDSCFPIDTTYFIDKTCTSLNIKYLFYLLNQLKLDETSRDSAVPGLSRGITYNKIVPYISIKYQTAIANFLDKKTAKIDALIEKDKRLIELLKEKRTALINHAVTKGLDPNVKLKDSGIQWIGEIPDKWSVRKIDKLSTVSRGASPRPIDDPKYFDDGEEYSWVRIADVTASGRYLLETTEKLSTLGKSLSVPLEPGRLFISIAGTVGKPIITKIKCCIHDGFVYFKNLKVLNEYLYHIFIGGQAYLGLGKLGTQLNLNTETIGLITIPLPPKEKQQKIVEYLDKANSKMDKTIQKIEEKINLLEKYKKSLIHYVVTGKVDVRGVEA